MLAGDMISKTLLFFLPPPQLCLAQLGQLCWPAQPHASFARLSAQLCPAAGAVLVPALLGCLQRHQALLHCLRWYLWLTELVVVRQEMELK